MFLCVALNSLTICLAIVSMSDRTQNWIVVVPELAEFPELDEPDVDDADEHAASVTAAIAAVPKSARLRLIAPAPPGIGEKHMLSSLFLLILV
jgi:hypothetical protein